MINSILKLVVSASVVVMAVKYLLIPGIANFSAIFKLSGKARGQVIGYATSIPEFTVLVAGAFAGVFNAGLWNIASSNIINSILFLVTITVFRQQLDLKKKWFKDELAFGIISILLPLSLIWFKVGAGLSVALGLILFFMVYRICDQIFNKHGKPAPLPEGIENGNLFIGLALLLAGVFIILLAGRFLSSSAGNLILIFNLPEWAVGWVLGFISSISELTSFVEIYKIHKPKRIPGYIKDTQEAIDALVTSNVSNLGLILPLGIFIYLLIR
jgi:Ca2+/Na+ antiporter